MPHIVGDHDEVNQSPHTVFLRQSVHTRSDKGTHQQPGTVSQRERQADDRACRGKQHQGNECTNADIAADDTGNGGQQTRSARVENVVCTRSLAAAPEGVNQRSQQKRSKDDCL